MPKIIILLLFLVICKSDSKRVITPNTFIAENGVIFEKLGEINFITTSHNLVISFDSNSIIKAGNELLDIMENSEQIVKNNSHYLETYYLSMLGNLMKEFNEVFLKYKHYINNTNYNNNRDLNNIIDKVEKRGGGGGGGKSMDTDEIYILDSYISKVNISNINASKIENAIYRANLIRRTLIAHYNTSHNLHNSSSELIMSFSLTFFEFCVRDFNQEIEQFLYKLNSILTTGKNSILIITPRYFTKVLKQLQDDIPLLYPPTDKFMPKYYSICSSEVGKKNEIIYYVIKIPVISSYKFWLYRIHRVSIPISNLPGWSRNFDAPKDNYLAISNDGSQYVIFNHLEDSCISSPLTSAKICNSVQQIQRASVNPNNCLLAAYLNQKNTNTKCNFTYEYNGNSNFIVVEDFWIGSILKDEMQINKICLNSQQFTFKVKRGIIRIPISNNCTYIGDTFILPYSEIKVDGHGTSGGGGGGKNVEVILLPLRVNFSNYNIISKLFSRLKFLTSNDINTFEILREENSPFINKELNFVFFISAVIYMIVITCVLIFYLRLKIWLQRRNNNDGLLPPPTPPLPPPPPPPSLSEEEEAEEKQQQQRHAVTNPQYFCSVVSHLPPPLPPPSPPIYEECHTYVDMRQNYGKK